MTFQIALFAMTLTLLKTWSSKLLHHSEIAELDCSLCFMSLNAVSFKRAAATDEVA